MLIFFSIKTTEKETRFNENNTKFLRTGRFSYRIKVTGGFYNEKN